MKIFFQDKDSNPLNNFLKAYIPLTVIIFFLLIAFPVLDSDKIDATILWFIIPAVILIVYHGILWYQYSKHYLCELVIEDRKLILHIASIKGEAEEISIEIDNDFMIEMRESLWSFNTIGISTFIMRFKIAGKVVYSQYPVGRWNTNEFKRILSELKSLGVSIKSSIPIK